MLRVKWLCSFIFIASNLSVFSGNSIAVSESKYDKHRKIQLQKYNNYKTDYLKKYERYKLVILKKWGVAELSSKSEFFSYNTDNNIKILADFKNDIIEVSILNSDGLTDKDIEKSVQTAILQSLNVSPQQALKNENETLNKQPKTLSLTNKVDIDSKSLLAYMGLNNSQDLSDIVTKKEEVLQKNQQKIVYERTNKRLEDQILNLDNYSSFAKEGANKEQTQKLKESLEQDIKQLNDEKAEVTQKNIRTYKIKLDRKRYQKAESYLEEVKNNALKWNVPKEIILAIMETESNFNPMARSHIPAYGLMQIVPSTAGADVNNKIFNIKGKPTPNHLYDSTKNIAYGSAYFNILMSRYLNTVKNPLSRLYCAIASYNTGIGNVSKAFNHGSKNRLKAINIINTLTPNEVYNVLKSRTHTETQRYLDKVIRSKKYFYDATT